VITGRFFKARKEIFKICLKNGLISFLSIALIAATLLIVNGFFPQIRESNISHPENIGNPLYEFLNGLTGIFIIIGFPVAEIAGIYAVTTGIMALVEERKTGEVEKWPAITGIILGVLGTGVVIGILADLFMTLVKYLMR
jgi:cell division protein FtsX